jgi:glyoxylate reductase
MLRQAGCKVTVPSDHGLPSRSSLLQAVGSVDAILSILTERIDAEVMNAATRLKVISNMAVGYDNIDVAEASRRGIAVCNTPGVLTETTADFAWALLMAVARRVVECHQLVLQGEFQWWGPQMMMGTDVFGKTLGIVGFGKIGQAMAKRAQGFGMPVLYSGDTAPASSPLGRKVGFDSLLAESDFVSLHVPYRESTHHLIGTRELNLMKSTAFLINTARGPVVNETELVTALNSGAIAGAGLDVFEKEPEVHPGLLTLKNVVLAPHAASASVATRELMANMAAQNLLAYLRGETPHSVVNPEASL